MRTLLISLFLLGTLASCSREVPEKKVSLDTPAPLILALGDSLTAGYGLPIAESYPSQLESRLTLEGYRYRVQNAGISGDTTAGVLGRLDWLLEGEIPELVILCIGANDAFQSKPVTEIESNIRTIIAKLKAKNIRVVLAGMKAPLNIATPYRSAYEAIFPRIASDEKLPYYPFFLE